MSISSTSHDLTAVRVFRTRTLADRDIVRHVPQTKRAPDKRSYGCKGGGILVGKWCNEDTLLNMYDTHALRINVNSRPRSHFSWLCWFAGWAIWALVGSRRPLFMGIPEVSHASKPPERDLVDSQNRLNELRMYVLGRISFQAGRSGYVNGK